MPEFGQLIRTTDRGLYCEAGGFYVDPWRPVDRAVVTHAHSDHACYGCRHYLSSTAGELLMRLRMPPEADFQFVRYGETVNVGPVKVSLHPAGHMLGSAMVRLEHRGRVALVSGDYKLGSDPTCAAWEPVRCHLLVTETTFGLPVYRWPDPVEVFADINRWWTRSAALGMTSILYAYAIGKSQRLLAGLDPSIGPIYTHGAVEKGVQAYRDSGIAMPPTTAISVVDQRNKDQKQFAGSMILAVPSAHATAWLRRFGKITTAMASGWMAVRGNRRRRSVDRGFILSDHVDWPELIEATELCQPETIWTAHGYTAAAARFLSELGYDAHPLWDWNRPATESESDELPDSDSGNSASGAGSDEVDEAKLQEGPS
ncbi:MAG TPA: ligase-associated DNA damage response exonuclease [Planctomycetaceae bacterium]|nr:ligase-associated DNA damage response exonuclease [Planctomycetaceae bacterium]